MTTNSVPISHYVIGETFENKPFGAALACSARNRGERHDIFLEKVQRRVYCAFEFHSKAGATPALRLP